MTPQSPTAGLSGAQSVRPGQSDADSLRIVTWNCAGAFHRKLEYLLELKPDLAVVPEACMPEKLKLPVGTTTEWVGRLAYKGLLVIGFGDWNVKRVETYEPRLEWILPVSVDGPARFTLVGVWAKNHRSQARLPEDRPRRQPLAAVDVYEKQFSTGPTVVAGDFNDAAIWDTPRRSEFANLVARYRQEGLCSAYHAMMNMDFGHEAQPTHWWRDRRRDGLTYHIDYAFIPDAWLGASKVEVGGFDWSVARAGSDHAPIIVDVNLAALAHS